MVRARNRGPAKPTWTPNQVVAGNLVRLRQRRRLTQAEVARLLSSVAGKDWTEAMVAHAERSVTGNRVREFTADDLVTLVRVFDVPVLYFLTPPPKGILVHVPGSRIDTITMLEAVLGSVDNLAEWETLLDEWNLAKTKNSHCPSPKGGASKSRHGGRKRADITKDNGIAEAGEQFFEESVGDGRDARRGRRRSGIRIESRFCHRVDGVACPEAD